MDTNQNAKRCVAIVLAAGTGKRMNSKTPKQFMLLQDKPVVWYSLQVFEQTDMIDEIILVTGKDDIPYVKEQIVERFGFQKVSKIVSGGAQRYDSVYQALEAMDNHSGFVFIHDGARPFLTSQILLDLKEAVECYQACVTATRVKDTIKIADENGFVSSTPNRDGLWSVQTPQVFSGELIWEAYQKLKEELPELTAKGIQVTDDAMVVEQMMSKKIRLVPGNYDNIKITTPEDLTIAKSILEKRL